MYYPYLRSKQNEMLALRDMALSPNQYEYIVPIIEPVRDLPALCRTTVVLEQHRIPYSVVLNTSDAPISDTWAALHKEGYECIIPALVCDGRIEEVKEYLDSSDMANVTLVFKDDMDTDNEVLFPLLEHTRVKTIVGSFNRSLKRTLHNTGKTLVTFNADAFQAKVSNSQYGACLNEKYTEEHSFFREDGFDGFSDFCVLPKVLQEGGMTPTTLAIHLTYKKNKDEIWVRHFLSDSNVGRENIQHKFMEAANHVKDFYVEHKHTEAVDVLLNNLETGHYPGLGTLKRYTVWNHLELVNRLLRDKEQ